MEIPFGNLSDGKLFRAAAGEFKELELKALDGEDVEKAVAYYVDRFAKLESKFQEIESKINNSSNKGSFLSSLLNIKEQLADHDGLGDYQALKVKINQYVNLLEDYVAKNRQKNTDIKQALLLELEAVLANNDIEEAFEQIKSLKSRWIKTGSPSEELKEELEAKFKEGVDSFFERRNAFDEDRKELLDSRVGEYKGIIDRIEEVLKSKKLQDAFEEVKSLQNQWKEIGRIPEDTFQELNNQYWELCKKFFDSRKKEQKQAVKNRNKSKKESLAQRQEVISKLEVVRDGCLDTEAVASLKSIQSDWKSCGPLSRRDNAEIHDRYLELSRAVQERQFVVQLANKKVRGFASKKGKDRYQSLMKVAKDLLRRDENELSSFQENMDKMHINKGSFVDMLEAKLNAQQEKVAIKRAILKDLQSKIKES